MKSHLEVINIKEHSPEWYAFRLTGIGGSEAGSVLGLNKWEASIELFHKKIGTVSMNIEPNEAMFHGTHLEEYVAKLWQYWDGEDGGYMRNYNAQKVIRKARRVNGYVKNPKYPWLFASVDRLMNIGSHKISDGSMIEEEGILEVKTISSWSMKMWEGGIPPYHITQVIQYMTILETDYAEFAILKDGRYLSVLPVDLKSRESNVIAERILDETKDFWYNRVVPAQEAYRKRQEAERQGNTTLVQECDAQIAELEPLPDGSEAYKKFLSQSELREPDTAEGDMSQYELAKKVKMAQAMKKRLEEVETKAKSELMKYMRDNNVEVLDFDNLGYCDLKGKKGSDNLTFNVRIKQKPDDEDINGEVNKLEYDY